MTPSQLLRGLYLRSLTLFWAEKSARRLSIWIEIINSESTRLTFFHSVGSRFRRIVSQLRRNHFQRRAQRTYTHNSLLQTGTENLPAILKIILAQRVVGPSQGEELLQPSEPMRTVYLKVKQDRISSMGLQNRQYLLKCLRHSYLRQLLNLGVPNFPQKNGSSISRNQHLYMIHHLDGISRLHILQI